MKEVSQELLNQMLVDTFNSILVLQESYINKHCSSSVTMNEVHTLEAIDRLNKPTMAQVSAYLMVTPGTLTTSVKRLEKKGYVRRQQNKDDRRVFHLSITPAAKKITEVHEGFHQRMIEGIINNPKIDLNSVANTLEVLLAFFEDLKKEYAK